MIRWPGQSGVCPKQLLIERSIQRSMRAAVERQSEEHCKQRGKEDSPTDAAAPGEEHGSKAFLYLISTGWLHLHHDFGPLPGKKADWPPITPPLIRRDLED
jgi:hypothetical protein